MIGKAEHSDTYIVTMLTLDKALSKSGIPDHIICFGPARSLSDYNGQIPSHRHLYVSQPQGNCVHPNQCHITLCRSQ